MIEVPSFALSVVWPVTLAMMWYSGWHCRHEYDKHIQREVKKLQERDEVTL
jgi:hypothetical protein